MPSKRKVGVSTRAGLKQSRTKQQTNDPQPVGSSKSSGTNPTQPVGIQAHSVPVVTQSVGTLSVGSVGTQSVGSVGTQSSWSQQGGPLSAVTSVPQPSQIAQPVWPAIQQAGPQIAQPVWPASQQAGPVHQPVVRAPQPLQLPALGASFMQGESDPLPIVTYNDNDIFISEVTKSKIWDGQYIELALLLKQNFSAAQSVAGTLA